MRDIDGHHAITHTGEAVGFLTSNIVFPHDREAIVVEVNAMVRQRPGHDRARDHRHSSIRKARPTRPRPGRRAPLYNQLRTGRLDRSLLTANANFYFTPEVLHDYQASLAPLGDPQSFTADGPPEPRGGFVNRNYTLTFAGRRLNIVTYCRARRACRIEQYLVYPAA